MFDYLDWNKANTPHTYLDLVVGNFFGADFDQDTESFFQLIDSKVNFAVGNAAGDAVELANYTFGKNALFSCLLRGLAVEWYENKLTNVTTWVNVRTSFVIWFLDGKKTNFGTEGKNNIALEKVERDFGIFNIAPRELGRKNSHTIWKE